MTNSHLGRRRFKEPRKFRSPDKVSVAKKGVLKGTP
jgi:hypothetical protein